MELELSLNGLDPLFTPEQSDRGVGGGGGGVCGNDPDVFFLANE